jgi:hypothetical protein
MSGMSSIDACSITFGSGATNNNCLVSSRANLSLSYCLLNEIHLTFAILEFLVQ